MGVVYEAHHEALGRRVAIKVLHALAAEAPKAGIARARFLREGRAAAQVRHDHVVDVFDFGVDEGTPFLVMELVEGESLAERIEREGTLPLATALELMLPILSAVGALHAAGIIHRDLKPANILLGRGRAGDVSPKVVDFGVSRADDDLPGLTESGVVVGSYPYMPPEQARACKEATEQADQYAIGAILYECATGKRPFDGNSPYDLTHAILHAPLIPPSERNAELPKALDAVLARALSRDPESRFKCVDDLGAALLAFADPELAARWASEFLPATEEKTGATMAPAAAVRIEPPARARRPWRPAIVASVVACAGLAVGAFALRGRPPTHSAVTARVPVSVATIALAPAAEPLRVASVAEEEPETKTLAPRSPMTAPIAVTTSAPAAAPSSRTTKPPRARPLANHRRDEAPLDNGAPLLDPQ